MATGDSCTETVFGSFFSPQNIFRSAGSVIPVFPPYNPCPADSGGRAAGDREDPGALYSQRVKETTQETNEMHFDNFYIMSEHIFTTFYELVLSCVKCWLINCLIHWKTVSIQLLTYGRVTSFQNQVLYFSSVTISVVVKKHTWWDTAERLMELWCILL